MTILFVLPIIGQLACIIMAFAAKNYNRRHYARSVLIMIAIGIVLAAAAFAVLTWIFNYDVTGTVRNMWYQV
jgi:hypothetical protein